MLRNRERKGVRGIAQLLLVCGLWCGVGFPLWGQVTRFDSSVQAEHRRALSYWGQEGYAVAEGMFASVERKALMEGNELLASEAAYYRARCVERLGRADAKGALRSFLLAYEHSVRHVEAQYALGNLYYQEGDWAQAAEWYPSEEESHGVLTHEQSMEMCFKQGYSHMMSGERAKARGSFAKVKESNTYYRVPARYYYAHLAYEDSLYSLALREFDLLEGDASFGGLVPYYKGQIYYLQGNYEQVVDYVSPRVDSLTGRRKGELERLLAESYFRLGDYRSARAPLERYIEREGSLTRADYYLAGFVYYKLEEYKLATEYLGRVLTEEDSITQNANYVLGDCYLQQGDKTRARQALGMASRLPFDTLMQEDAHFSYACLTLESRDAPFSDAVGAFTEYLEQYPWSSRRDLAYSYLGMAFVETRDYARALEVLSRIDHSSAITRRAMQRAAYFRGVELFQNRRFEEALSLFNTALEYEEQDARIRALTLYWRGETHYRQKQYALAVKDWQAFRKAPGAYGLEREFRLSNCHLGYGYYLMEMYKEAEPYFRSWVEAKGASKEEQVEGYNRAGDCKFLMQDYWGAIDYYESGAALQVKGSDYSLYQSGFSLGLVNRNAKKAARLQTLLRLWPNSSYRVAAYYALAQLYQNEDSLAQAKMYYGRVVEDYPTDSLAAESLVQLGLVYYAEGHYERAKGYLERVVKEYGDTKSKQEALLALERVYQNEGDVQGYVAFLERAGYGDQLSAMKRDSLYYANAEQMYMWGEYAKAEPLLEAYLRDYPRGVGSTPAQFFLGDCLLHRGDTVGAINRLREVLQSGDADYREKTLRVLAEVEEARAEYAIAGDYYGELVDIVRDKQEVLACQLGGLRCASAVQNDDLVFRYAGAVLAHEGSARDEREYAHYQLGGAYRRTGRLEEAYRHYAQVGDNMTLPSVAESRYRRIEVRSLQKKWDEVKQETMSFAQLHPLHEEWLARSFILLGEAYGAEGDFFQAKATLQSVLDGYRGAEKESIYATAKASLASLLEAERAAQALGDHHDTVKFIF